jgi:hypothetical protein
MGILDDVMKRINELNIWIFSHNVMWFFLKTSILC